MSETFAAMDRALAGHEAYVKDVEAGGDDVAVKEARLWLGRNYARAGEAAFLCECFEQALDYYAREEELNSRLEIHGPVYRVGALAALGRTDEAIARLDAIADRLVATGQWRTTFEQHRAFDALRDDPKVKAIMERWREAERAGGR